MELTLKHIINGEHDSIGSLSIDGNFECYTLEDEKRNVKVYGETRIWAGRYKIEPRKVGRIAAWLKKIFPNVVNYSLWIKNVPQFEYILIHPGTTDKDTYGCVLVGEDFDKFGDKHKLVNSRKAYLKLHKKISKALDKGEEVWITILD